MTRRSHAQVDGVKCSCPECLAKRRAYHAERRAAGTEEARKPDTRHCWRCGVIFDGSHSYHSDAPCKDCRYFLRHQHGDTTIWKGSEATKAGSVAA